MPTYELHNQSEKNFEYRFEKYQIVFVIIQMSVPVGLIFITPVGRKVFTDFGYLQGPDLIASKRMYIHYKTSTIKKSDLFSALYDDGLIFHRNFILARVMFFRAQI